MVSQLAQVLDSRDLSTLWYIDLHDNELECKYDMRELDRIAEGCPNLKKLDLSFNALGGPRFVIFLKKMLQNAPRVVVYIGGNPQWDWTDLRNRLPPDEPRIQK